MFTRTVARWTGPVLAVLLTCTLSSLSPAVADHVVPVPGPANPQSDDCAAGTVGLKYEPVSDGTATDGTFSVDIDVVDTADGPTFDFSNATHDVTEVFVKGGTVSNQYVYDPDPVRADTGLHAPINPANDKYFGLSHLIFCYALTLDISKTADPTYVRTWPWDIDKSVTPATWDLFEGDDGTSDYEVEVTKGDPVDSDFAVSGTITIENNNVAATITGVTDAMTGGIDAPVECGVTFPHVLAANTTLECTYETALPDGTDRTNTATVTTTGAVRGGTATAPVDFGDPTTLVNDTINVTDSVQGDLGSFNSDGSTSYSRTFDCDDDEGTHPNTATIEETGQSDDASVTVNCYDLTVAKGASTSLTRTWTWDIDKSADQTDLVLAEGQLFNVNYEVEVSATSADTAHHVEGDIIVTNPNPTLDAELTQFVDEVSDSIGASVDCPGLTVPAGGSLTCSYSTDLPDGADRTNTATATLQNHSYAPDGTATATGTTDYSGSAPVTFADATVTEIDECIDVTDTNVGTLGTVCASDAPKTFSYTLTFGPDGPYTDVVVECGDNTHDNTAAFTTNDTGTTGDDTWTVDVTVACDFGCTLTPGYWKTHSVKGPAPYDDAWANLGPQQENTTFFLSGKTYYQALWTAPQGNAYWILAHAYIAAQLNILNGASVPAAVQTAFDQATALLASRTPPQVASLKGAQRQQWITLAGILDGYNNGLTGPGHCSENP
jgi:hypothetical protein